MYKKYFRKMLCLSLSAALGLSMLTGATFAGEGAVPSLTEEAVQAEEVRALPAEGASLSADQIYFTSGETEEQEESVSDPALAAAEAAAGVTEEMCRADYWFNKSTGSGIDIDKPLISKEEVPQLNALMMAIPETNMHDLENMSSTYDADSRREALAKSAETDSINMGKDKYYVNGAETDIKGYLSRIAGKISETGYTGSSVSAQYAVCTRRTLISTLPTNDYIGYSAEDMDDEKANSALNINEPFLIGQRAVIDGETFYWGYSDNCTGWVDSSDLALCRDKEEWLDMWKVDPAKDDFLVVRENQIHLEPSLRTPAVSGVKLTFATILKLVPEEERPESVTERGAWNNHVVFLPTRAEDGTLVKRCALISQHYDVSCGFPVLTQRELLKAAFNNLGDRYGWGGMTDAMDCSLYTRNIYHCFGINLPRNTTWQNSITPRKIDLSAMKEEEKLSAIRKMPAGTLLFFTGHITMYTGTADYQPEGAEETPDNKMAYVISDAGSLSDSVGETAVKTMYSVLLTPLNVKRRNGTTWVGNVQSAILPVSDEIMAYVESLVKEEAEPEKIKAPAAEGQTYADSSDTLPLETFLMSTGNIYLSFSGAAEAGLDSLQATVIKGSRLTTKAPVKSISCDKATASVSISRKNSLGTITLKKSGEVSFEMADGSTYRVSFIVETPKARTAEVKEIIKNAKEAGDKSVKLPVSLLFGSPDGGSLELVSQTVKDDAAKASVADNVLTLDPGTKNTIKIRYQYLDKKYNMTVSVK